MFFYKLRTKFGDLAQAAVARKAQASARQYEWTYTNSEGVEVNTLDKFSSPQEAHRCLEETARRYGHTITESFVFDVSKGRVMHNGKLLGS